jgi:hypothetical protein
MGEVARFTTEVMDLNQYTTEAQQPKAVEKFAAELDCVLRNWFGYRRAVTFAHSRTINVRRANVCLYLWLCYKPPREHGFRPQWTPVIASIEFRDVRAGHGPALLEFLARRAPEFGYGKIGVESAGLVDGIKGFFRHFFEPYWQQESLHPDANWVASVRDIAGQLAKDREERLC